MTGSFPRLRFYACYLLITKKHIDCNCIYSLIKHELTATFSYINIAALGTEVSPAGQVAMPLEKTDRVYAKARKQGHGQVSRHRRKREVEDGEDEKPAKKRTGLSSSTLAKSFETVRPWPDKPDPTFFGIPLELRLEVCKHFLTLDRDPEHPPSAVPYQNWDLIILRINKQIRAEGLRLLQKTNTWIAVCFIAENKQQLAAITQATLRNATSLYVSRVSRDKEGRHAYLQKGMPEFLARMAL